MTGPTVVDIRRYPVKSMGGESLSEAALDERGLVGDRWFAVCDERINRDRQREQGIVSLLFGIPGSGPGRFHAWLVSHRAGGSRVRTVSPNLAGRPDSGLTQVLAELDVPAVGIF